MRRSPGMLEGEGIEECYESYAFVSAHLVCSSRRLQSGVQRAATCAPNESEGLWASALEARAGIVYWV